MKFNARARVLLFQALVLAMVAAAMASLGPVAAAAVEPGWGSASGFVRGVDGERIAGVLVEAFASDAGFEDEPLATATTGDGDTGSLGDYSLDLPEGAYRLRYSGVGLMTRWYGIGAGQIVDVYEGRDADQEPVTMSPATDAVIHGFTALADGRRVNDIVVQAWEAGATEPVASARSYAGGGESNGYFALYVGPGTYEIRYSDPRGRFAEGALPELETVGTGESVSLGPIDLTRLKRSVVVSVKDVLGSPLDGVTVRVWRYVDGGMRRGARGATDAEGNAAFDIGVGSQVVFCSYDETRYCYRGADHPRPADTIRIPGGAGPFEAPPIVRDIGAIAGSVVDADGSPVAATHVRLTRINERGRLRGRTWRKRDVSSFAFDELPRGHRYVLCAIWELEGATGQTCVGGSGGVRDSEPVLVPADAESPVEVAPIVVDPILLSGSLVDEAGDPYTDDADIYVYRFVDGDVLDHGYGYTSGGGDFIVGIPATSDPLTVCVDDFDYSPTVSGCLGGGTDPHSADTFLLPEGTDGFDVGDITMLAPCRGRVITNGVVSLGVNCLGQLNIDMVGLTYNETGNDSTVAGCPCEGWGVADATGEVSGYANNSSGISDNLELLDFDVAMDDDGVPVTATSVVQVADDFVITHDYRPSPLTANAYEVNVTVENITDASQDLRYRRVMDWDIEPTEFDEYVTMQTGDAEELVYTSNDGFATADPLAGPSDGSAVGELFEGDFVDAGPDDHGALFDFSFGSLLPGESKTFHTYYGAAGTETGALDALAAISAEAYSLGQPSTPDGPTLGTPNTFLFAFSGVGGSAVKPPDARDDSYVVGAGAVDELLTVLDNDTTEIAGRSPRIVSSTQPANGTVECTFDLCSYTPNAGFGVDAPATDSFRYTITDGRGGFDSAVVSLTVNNTRGAENTVLPVITGSGKVGSALTGSNGTWTPSEGLTFTYRWLRDATPIAGATSASYTPLPGDLAHTLTFEVTANRTGSAPVRAVSLPVTVVTGDAPVPSVLPSVSSPVTVGRLVTASTGTWAPAPTGFAFQWLLDGSPVAGATSGSFLPSVGDVGKSLQVRVTTRLPGYQAAERTASAVTVNAAPAARNTVHPVLSGIPAVGQELSASPGSWSGTGLTFLYEWQAGGEVVQELSPSSTWTVAGDEGQRVQVRVVARKAGQLDGEALTNVLEIGAVAAEVTAPPSITGDVKVDETVTVDDADFEGEGFDVTTNWYLSYWPDRAESPYRFLVQKGGDSFAIPSWMGGYYLEVEQVASAAGKAPVPAASARTRVEPKPYLYGDYRYLASSPKVGVIATAPTGAWYSYNPDYVAETGVTETVEWYVDGTRVHTGPTFTPASGDGGKWLYAYVTGTKPGFQTGSTYVSGQRIRFADEGEAIVNVTVKRAGPGGLNVPGSYVSVCSDSAGCAYGTARSGRVSIAVPSRASGTDVRVSVTPPYETGLLARTVTTRVSTLDETDLTVPVSTPIPAPEGTGLDDTIGSTDVDTDGDGEPDGSYPTVYYSDPQTLTVTGCEGIDPATWTVEFSNGSEPMTGTLTESSETAGRYTGLIPGFTSTGKATISTNVPLTCDGTPIEFSLYIDPSGIVTDQFGRPLVGARATLLHLNGGAMVPVPDQSLVMSPANRNNPSFTDDTGFFRWDVNPGTYQVQISDATSEGAACDVTTTPRMNVPPERVDLLIKTPCPGASKPIPSTDPVLSGTTTVGQTLSVTQGTWSDGIVYERTEWLRDGAVVGTGSTYELKPADATKRITAKVYARRPSYVQENGSGELVVFDPTTFELESATVAAAPVTPVGGSSAVINTAMPTVTGTPKVGATLTANPGTWSVDGLTFGYQWLRDGEAITGATVADYTAVAADLGAQVSVLVTASKSGSTPGTATSDPVAIGKGAAPENLSKPLVTGTPEVGETLTVSDGGWDTEGLTFGYQWVRDGEPIEGATAATYVVTEDDLGSELTARVTATKAGYEDGTAVASGLTVPEDEEPVVPAESKIKGKVQDRKIPKGTRGELRVRITSLGEAVPTGLVEVSVGKKTVAFDLTEADGGVLDVVLPKLKPGKHPIEVRYAGDELTEPSTKSFGKLTVKNKKAKKGKGNGKGKRIGIGGPIAA